MRERQFEREETSGLPIGDYIIREAVSRIREGPEKEALFQLSTEDYIARERASRTLGMRERIVSFLLWIYVGVISASFILFFLQGFKPGGFDLSSDFLKWLGGITIGEIAGLLSLTIGAVFRRIT